VISGCVYTEDTDKLVSVTITSRQEIHFIIHPKLLTLWMLRFNRWSKCL